jgi:hypothetical protein
MPSLGEPTLEKKILPRESSKFASFFTFKNCPLLIMGWLIDSTFQFAFPLASKEALGKVASKPCNF